MKFINAFTDIMNFDNKDLLGWNEELKNKIKFSLGYKYSKLEAKRQGIYNAYVGSSSDEEARYIRNKMFEQYGIQSQTVSTIYPSGQIFMNQF